MNMNKYNNNYINPSPTSISYNSNNNINNYQTIDKSDTNSVKTYINNLYDDNKS
jgi:hypothetical protein